MHSILFLSLAGARIDDESIPSHSLRLHRWRRLIPLSENVFLFHRAKAGEVETAILTTEALRSHSQQNQCTKFGQVVNFIPRAQIHAITARTPVITQISGLPNPGRKSVLTVLAAQTVPAKYG